MKSSGKQDVLAPAVGKVIEVVLKCAADVHMPSSLRRVIIGLVGDLVDCYGQKMKLLAADATVAQLLVQGLASEDNQTVNVTIWARDVSMCICFVTTSNFLICLSCVYCVSLSCFLASNIDKS